jgi:hypothetical protein
MIFMKRKAMCERSVADVQSQPLKKVRTNHPSNVANLSYEHTGLDCMPAIPSQSVQDEDYDVVDVDDPELRPQPTSRPKPPAVSRKAKEGFAEEQVSFIIITRDNNKPDPHGQQSSTYAPLSWPAVADAYNKKFRVGLNAVGSAAMEKRARQHRETWLAAHPGYPRSIIYAKKMAVPKVKVLHEPKAKRTERVEEPVRKSNIQRQRKVIPTARKAHTMTKHEAVRTAERSTRVAGWLPPDRVRNQGVYSSADRDILLDEPEDNEYATIEVYDVHENVLGAVRVLTQDIVETSAFVAEQRRFATNLCMTLQAPSLKVVERYVQCISPVQLEALPDFEVRRGTFRNGTVDARIVWNFTALVDLYNVASVLRDACIRQLVMDRWIAMQNQDIEFELDLQTLASLCDSTELDDPGQAFWANALYSAGLAEEIIGTGDCHPSLLRTLSGLMAG